MNTVAPQQLETFLIVAYKPVRRAGSKAFRSVRRRLITVAGDGRLKSVFPVEYYRPRLYHTGEILLKLRLLNSLPSKAKPISQIMTSRYDEVNQEFVNVMEIHRFGHKVFEESYRSKTIFESILGKLEALEEKNDSFGSDLKSQIESLKTSHDSLKQSVQKPPLASAPFSLTLKFGFVFFQSEQDCWVSSISEIGEGDLPAIGAKSVADCIISSLGRLFLDKLKPDRLTSTMEALESYSEDTKSDEGFSSYDFRELGWFSAFKEFLGPCKRFILDKDQNSRQANFDPAYFMELLQVANRIYQLCVEPFHEIILNSISKNTDWNSDKSSISVEESDSESSSEESSDNSDEVEQDSSESSGVSYDEGKDPQLKYLERYLRVKSLFEEVLKPRLAKPFNNLDEVQDMINIIGPIDKFYQRFKNLVYDVSETPEFSKAMTELGLKLAVEIT
jgi:hypothetical protein